MSSAGPFPRRSAAHEQRELVRRTDALHGLLAAWLDTPGLTVACGHWEDGAVSEIVPEGRAVLLPARYGGVFAGVRELRLTGAAHHLHIDLGRVERLRFTLAPCVCLGFKPSFEVRLMSRNRAGTASGDWSLSLMLGAPYAGESLDQEAARGFLARACAQLRAHPELTEIVVDEQVRASLAGQAILPLLREHAGTPDGDWPGVLRALRPAAPHAEPHSAADPAILPLLREALRLPDATLVLHRERVLVEFQTELLDGVHRYEEQGHVSWQIGAQHDHHSHLSLSAVDHVLFSAQASPCQGGGLNYTVWFQTARPSGNPFQPHGYFSVTLNRPYAQGRPRVEVIEPLLDLYRRFRDAPWVVADAAFLRVLAEGPPTRAESTVELQENLT